MKGCLKQCSRAPSPTGDHPVVKHVAFGADEQVEVFFADEWDRTPAEPARNLSYQDILELKEIQRSLPRAIQPADLIGSRTPSHGYLSTVPIGLLPLLPEADPFSPPTPTSTASSLTVAHNSWRTLRTPAPSIPQQHPSHLLHLPPARTPLHRPKPRFAFLPLLEPTITTTDDRSRTPSPPPLSESERSASPDFDHPNMSHDQLISSSDPPTPALTNASIDSSPRSSRASSCSTSPEPTFLQLPPSCAHGRFCGVKSSTPPTKSLLMDDRLAGSEPWIRDFQQYDYRRPGFGASRTPITAPVKPVDIPPTTTTTTTTMTKKKRKEKKVIVINDIEIELDDDDDDGDDEQEEEEEEEEESHTPPAKASVIPNTTTDSRPFATSHSAPTTMTFNLHTPISFKRTPTPASCSPPRATNVRGQGVLVPSA